MRLLKEMKHMFSVENNKICMSLRIWPQRSDIGKLCRELLRCFIEETQGPFTMKLIFIQFCTAGISENAISWLAG